MRPLVADGNTVGRAKRRLRAVALGAAFLVWMAVVITGLGQLWVYAETPGPSATAPDSWPTASHIVRDTHRPLLLMFLHPQCPCSRASVGELALLMAHVQGQVTAKVFVYRPVKEEPDWEHTDLWTSAAAIPGVQVATDLTGSEAAIFGAAVSGQTLLYDRDGRLTFNGGITAARGHAGDNPGRSTLLSLLGEGTAATSRTPVFGCALSDAPSE
jgi:hypothetical protein